jgi:serine kinase of HPr protein (carbohydrate metabolism regulator)
MVHSALVSRDGSGLMLCGPSTAGKSTLAYACARAGWTFLADDCAALLPDSAERMALGRPRQIRFRPDAPQLFPELEGYAVRTRPTGKLAFEVETSLLGIRTADRAPVNAIVLLERGGGHSEVHRISTEDALERLLTEMASYGEEVDDLHERTIRRVTAAPAYQLRYQSIEDGIRLLSAL